MDYGAEARRSRDGGRPRTVDGMYDDKAEGDARFKDYGGAENA